MIQIRFSLALLLLLSCTGFSENLKVPTGKIPGFGAAFSGSEDSFTFGLFGDRAGANPVTGWRYLEQAIEEMNALHPDFVLMPGDLIDGYMRQKGTDGAKKDFNEQFDEFEKFAKKLNMPLLFVPGNHDLPDDLMKAPFIERFGRLWYSFDYRNVHFIALCTEGQPACDDKPHHFTQEQVDWALEDIAASGDARHTVVFMHNPAWKDRSKSSLMYKQWLQMEAALQGRKYTVIAGHTHRLSEETRNGRPYYVMATSGGGQSVPSRFYMGRTHHIGLAKVEKDTLHLSVIELGATHKIENVAKTRKTPERIRTITSLHRTNSGFESEFAATVVNPLDRDIYARFSIEGLAHKGWRSSAGDRLDAVIAPGDSLEFRTTLSIADPTLSAPPKLIIFAENNGLVLVDHRDDIPLFKEEDYQLVTNWFTAAPFDGNDMAYVSAPYAPRKELAAMFTDFGPESKKWNRDDKFENNIGWKKLSTTDRNRLDLGAEYGYLVRAIGYATTFINSPDERLIYLQFSVNDYGRLFVNGSLVGDDIIYVSHGVVTLPVWLNQGRNSILVKTANLSNNWYFSLKVSNVDGALSMME
jgi:hypothetical protein